MPDLDVGEAEGQQEEKWIAFANRNNSDYKWQRARNVVGALEVVSEPILRTSDVMEPRYFKGRETPFREALEVWEDENLKKGFVDAVDNLPIAMCCCGFMKDDEETKKEFVPLLNSKWVAKANKKLASKGFKIDLFLWNWQNASGKAETNILLIRFFILSSYNFVRAFGESSMPFEFDYSNCSTQSFD